MSNGSDETDRYIHRNKPINQTSIFYSIGRNPYYGGMFPFDQILIFASSSNAMNRTKLNKKNVTSYNFH